MNYYKETSYQKRKKSNYLGNNKCIMSLLQKLQNIPCFEKYHKMVKSLVKISLIHAKSHNLSSGVQFLSQAELCPRDAR